MYRKERVASAVQQILGRAIVQRLNDPRVATLTTVTRVSVTGDLLLAKVYLSIQGDESAERRTMAAVRHARGFLQRLLAEELPMRQCPALRFEIDEGVKGARRTLALLSELRHRELADGACAESSEVEGAEDAAGPGPSGGVG